eukprot:1072109-Prymnesium_polylepis.1
MASNSTGRARAVSPWMRTRNPPPSLLNCVPSDIVVLILELLPTRAVAALACTCHATEEIIANAWAGISKVRFAATKEELAARSAVLMAKADAMRNQLPDDGERELHIADVAFKAEYTTGAGLPFAPRPDVLYAIAAQHDEADDVLQELLATLAVFERDW